MATEEVEEAPQRKLGAWERLTPGYMTPGWVVMCAGCGFKHFISANERVGVEVDQYLTKHQGWRLSLGLWYCRKCKNRF